MPAASDAEDRALPPAAVSTVVPPPGAVAARRAADRETLRALRAERLARLRPGAGQGARDAAGTEGPHGSAVIERSRGSAATEPAGPAPIPHAGPAAAPTPGGAAAGPARTTPVPVPVRPAAADDGALAEFLRALAEAAGEGAPAPLGAGPAAPAAAVLHFHRPGSGQSGALQSGAGQSSATQAAAGQSGATQAGAGAPQSPGAGQSGVLQSSAVPPVGAAPVAIVAAPGEAGVAGEMAGEMARETSRERGAEAGGGAAAPALQAASELDGLPGVGPGLAWALARAGLVRRADLAALEAAELAARLGPLGRLVPAEAWIAAARAEGAAR